MNDLINKKLPYNSTLPHLFCQAICAPHLSASAPAFDRAGAGAWRKRGQIQLTSLPSERLVLRQHMARDGGCPRKSDSNKKRRLPPCRFLRQPQYVRFSAKLPALRRALQPFRSCSTRETPQGRRRRWSSRRASRARWKGAAPKRRRRRKGRRKRRSLF